MTTQHKNYIFIGGTIVAIILGYSYFLEQQKEFNAITSFEECVDKGYLVMGTYPEECKIPGKKFVNPNQTNKEIPLVKEEAVVNDFKNYAYVTDGQSVVFKNGKGELPRTQAKVSSTTTLQQTNTILVVDINNDAREDTLFLIQSVSSSSKDVYISASVSLYNGFTGVNAMYVDKNITNAKITYLESKIILEYVLENSKQKLYKEYIFEGGILKEST